ncbi:MAG TPA: DUF885 family protein, partial [Xanthomonadales bacterium]|nr:DUF885 family protein [Xanthomonadales bacterium]
MRAHRVVLPIVLFALASCGGRHAAREQTAPTAESRAALYAIADEYVAAALARDPSPAYYSRQLELERHDALPDNSDAGRRAWERREDEWLARLDAIDAQPFDDRAAQVLDAQLREALEASVGLRVCHAERWNVTHFGGWHAALAELADRQPVATPAERAQALRRWRGFAAYVDNEIAAARRGLDTGYSVPRPIVDRVVAQVDALIVAKPGDSAFYAPANHANDP